jgi:hypothetical protein
MGLARGWAHHCRPFVYFAERDGLIKIGTSANVPQRMRTLRATLLALKPGGREMERQMHRTFAQWAVGGEWFEDCPELRVFISWLPLPDVPPPPPKRPSFTLPIRVPA